MMATELINVARRTFVGRRLIVGVIVLIDVARKVAAAQASDCPTRPGNGRAELSQWGLGLVRHEGCRDAFLLSYHHLPYSNMSTTWQAKASAKKAAQDALIPDALRLPSPPADSVLDVTTFPLDSVLSERDLEITSVADITTLLGKLSSGAWTAVEVTQAFCNRALVAHQLVCSSSSKRESLS